jgi:hypothetical protein
MKRYCLHPEAPKGCAGGYSAAHTVQRAILERYIAQDGHVVQIKMAPQAEPTGIFVGPEKVGINNATTFHGFCNQHDNRLFLPLERSAFDVSPHQVALLGFRAVCRDLYGKEAEIESAEASRQYAALSNLDGFEEKDRRHQALRVGRINALANLRATKDQFASMLNDESSLRYYAIEFDKKPVYFCSVAFLPEWDFDGNRLQDLSWIAPFQAICFSAWAKSDCSTAVFCWHDSSAGICEPFIDSLRKSDPSRLANRIISMAFEHSENVVFSENWWKAISESDRRLLVGRTSSGATFEDRKSTCLLDDGFSGLQSTVVAEYVNYGAELKRK